MTIKEQLEKSITSKVESESNVYGIEPAAAKCESIVEDVAIRFNLWTQFESSVYIENNNTAWILGNRYTMKELFELFKKENSL